MKTADILPFLTSPGCLTEGFNHPSRNGTTNELGLFQEHRFAFYYWLQWTQQLKGVVPSLITFDWHQEMKRNFAEKLMCLKS